VPIFSALSQEDLERVYSLIVRYEYKKGAIIVQPGSSPGKFMIVKKGVLKIISVSPDGRELILYIRTAGDFFGEDNLLREKETNYYAQAIDDTVLCTIGKKEFEQLMIKYPHIALKVMEGLCERLERIESLVKTISPKDVDSRIYMLLLDLSDRYGQEKKGGILIDSPMSREEMANCIGVARETLIRKFSLLKEKGIIEIIGHKQIQIKDIAGLRFVAMNSASCI
jgi:CRP/FNR family transcriptional regulator